MIKVAITGNAGSGKSMVASRLSELGAQHIDADIINASLIDTSRHLLKKIELISGIEETTHVDGKNIKNKQKISEIIFRNPEKRKRIETLLHPIIEANINLQTTLAYNAAYSVVEVPLLYEANMQSNFHSVILVVSPKQVLTGRMTRNRNIDEDLVIDILDCQDDHTNNMGRSDHILVNNDNPDRLYDITDKLHALIQETNTDIL